MEGEQKLMPNTSEAEAKVEEVKVVEGIEGEKGEDFYNRIKELALCGDEVLDNLLSNPDQIPKEWSMERKVVGFWGTIHDVNGEKAIKALYNEAGKWTWVWVRFSEPMDRYNCAAINSLN